MTYKSIISHKQYNRLKKFSPFFSHYLLSGKIPTGENKKMVNKAGNVLNISSGSNCIVGEAHGFNSFYSRSSYLIPCNTCYHHAYCFNQEYLYSNDAITEKEEKHHMVLFLKTMDDFLNHLEDVHKDLIK